MNTFAQYLDTVEKPSSLSWEACSNAGYEIVGSLELNAWLSRQCPAEIYCTSVMIFIDLMWLCEVDSEDGSDLLGEPS